ncbi:MAG: recombinase RmuC [Deltaproteobacteria bacterium CG1_02_45_11]|nr:MAG: recombinase RmuC [Deltaproteobacteria bacterium CG1_02_45_11]
MIEIIAISALLVAIISVCLNFYLMRKPKSDYEEKLQDLQSTFEKLNANLEKNLKDEFFRNRQEASKNFKETREEQAGSFRAFNETTEKKIDRLRETVESKLKAIQDDNTKQLEKMRETVDEKLQTTLEQRLGSSFKLVSERLEMVQKGLGEMQSLATGVGDLKKVLTNVKNRGVLGEYQLENILEQILTPDQYAKNVKTKAGSAGHVEFAVKLPAKSDADEILWLPIDAKFPLEDYQTLIEAYEQADSGLIEKSQKVFAKRIELFAKDISEKYIDPPNTTDFAVMFLPFEGLYAEVLRTVGLFEKLQRDYKIVVTGPTTISAFLNSLQMGFKTLAIEKRSSEVWSLLGAVKTEFENFGGILDKTKKKLQEASNVIDQAGVRTRVIERKLRDVQALPQDKAARYPDDI